MTTNQRADAARRIRPGMGGTAAVAMTRPEWVVSFGVIFLLMFNLPSTWFVSPFEAGSTGSPTQTTGVCLLAVAFALTWSRFDIGPVIQALRQEAVLPLLLVLIAASSFWSSDIEHTLRDALMFVLVAFLAYWMTTRFTLGSIVGVVAAAACVGAVLQVFMIRVYPQYAATGDAWIGTFKDKNIFGRHLSMAIVVLLLAARIHRRYRFAIYVVVLLDAAMLVRSQSQTAVVAAVATPILAAVFVAFRARRTLYGAVAIAVPLAIASGLALLIGNLSAITAQLGRNSTFTGRTDIWKAVWIEAQHRPLFGFGWMGFFTDDLNGPAKYVYLKVLKVPHSHNALLDMFVMLGAVGASLMLLLFLRLLVRGARVIRYYQGATGLFPIVYGGYAIVSSITEFGVFRIDAHFFLLVVAVVGAIPGRRDELDRVGARASSEQLIRPAVRPPVAAASAGAH